MLSEPRATYRLQLTPTTGFREAAGIVPYLAALGVSHLYLSPCFEARPGSTHGYDIVDFQRVRAELGGEAGLLELFDVARRHGLGVLLDIVPNHMAIGPHNPWWWDVLENGRTSQYADFFDLDWEGAEASEGLLLPILGDQYGRVLDAGEIRVERNEGRFVVRYADHLCPIEPASLSEVIESAADVCGSPVLARVAQDLSGLPSHRTVQPREVERRRHESDALKQRLALALTRERSSLDSVDAELARLNGNPDRLHELLERQPYRLAWWRIASRELSYRRFFDIDQLVALRMEDPRVFAATHVLVLRWLETGVIQGLRIDHVDGLLDPETYLRRLRDVRPDAWIVVEKILGPRETLPSSWPVDGTTGYDFLAAAGGLFIDSASEQALTALHRSFTGEHRSYPELRVDAKRLVLTRLFGGDLKRLTTIFVEICRRHRHHRDHTTVDLERVLSEAIAQFGVYRTYVAPGRTVSADDSRHIEEAVAAAAGVLHGEIPESLLTFLGDLLRLRVAGVPEREFALRFQQLTGPAMAKGGEDTAFYRYNRFVALNDVGCDPARFGVSVDEFHRHCIEARTRAPRGLLATSTHDTKRSEDVRARLALLSEIPDAWAAAVRRWAAWNERHRRASLPDKSDEYLLYQTLVGAWPISSERVVAFMLKAVREAKRRTSWRRPNTAYEDAVRQFAEEILRDHEFRADLQEFVDPLVEPGRVTALAQVLLKLVAPGVPDFYRGTELWDFSMVDPDNRRTVDFDARQRLLEDIEHAIPETVLARSDEGAPKLWLIRRALALRTRRPRLFGPASPYAAIDVRGRQREHFVAICRGGGVIAVVPRLVLGVGSLSDDTVLEIPRGRWRNCLGEETVEAGRHRLAELVARFPVALLEREDD